MTTNRLSQAQLGEYIDMAYVGNPHFQLSQLHKIQSLHGVNSIYPMFGRGVSDPKTDEYLARKYPNRVVSPYLSEGPPLHSKTGIPWEQAGKNKSGLTYDHSLVKRTIAIASNEDIAEFDPRYLHGTQPSVTSPGVLHYLEKGQNSPLYADQHQEGNQFPFVYIHGGTGQMRLLGGHHRATSALLKGEPLVARYAIGDY